MALDEPKENDEVFDIDGFQYLVNKEFLTKAQPIRVDFLVHGFKLDCGLDLGAGCNTCGSGSCG